MKITQEEINTALIERHEKSVFETLRTSKVAIAGLGGLGSNIAVQLCRSGVGELYLVDFDCVDITNLNRQHYFLKHIGMPKTDAMCEVLMDINPYIKVKTHNVKVTEDNVEKIFSGYDLVCEAFDRPEYKALLVNSALSMGKTVVSASGMAGHLSSNTIVTKKIGKKFYLCGDRVTDSKDVNGLMAPRVTVCASHQANMILRILLGETEV